MKVLFQSIMQRKFFFLFLLIGRAIGGLALEGNDDNATRDYFVQLYQTEDYISDFRSVFRSENDKRDYKKIREYLNVKEEMLRVLRMAGDEYYYGLSYSKQFATDYIRSLEDEIRSRNANEKTLLRLHSMRPYFNYSGEYTIEYIQTVILPNIRKRYQEATEQDSLNQKTYMQIQKNILAIQQDIFQAEQAIYASLSPEFRDQDFRIWISLTFSGLVAVVLFAFFLIIYRRSDKTLYKHMLSSSGLQFITVFVLIIAIILFGILKVLGGSELAAILSGISGYILGKGGSEVIGKFVKEGDAPTVETEYEEERTEVVPESFVPVQPYACRESSETPAEGKIPERREEKDPGWREKKEPDEEKYFPGNDV